MHIVNRILAHLNMKLSYIVPPLPKDYRPKYNECLKKYMALHERFDYVIKEPYYDICEHPNDYVDFECAFAARCLGGLGVTELLDIGSYRHFLIGLMASLRVTTLDVREHEPVCANEKVVICDAKQLPFPDDSFEAILTLSSLEHFGLGRYGDDFDPEGDLKALKEIRRVLKPTGALVFSVPINGARPFVAYNAHRSYNYESIRSMLEGFSLVGEDFFIKKARRRGSREELTKVPGEWDSYSGFWRKDG